MPRSQPPHSPDSLRTAREGIIVPMSDPIPDAEPPAPVPARTPWRERVLGLRGVLAVSAASLIMGGLGGAAITSLVDDDRDGPGDRREGRHDRPHGGWGGGPGHPGGPPGGPNQGGPNRN